MKPKKIIALFGALALAITAFALTLKLSAATPTFTGDAAMDFIGPTVIKLNDRETPDVGLPDLNNAPAFPTGTISGFDIHAFYLDYDPALDVMYIGIDCFKICGDADDDGNPDAAGPILGNPVNQNGLGGRDEANFGPGESFGLLIDTDNDYDSNNGTGDFDVVIGVRESDDLTQLGVYEYSGEVGEQLLDDVWGTRLPFTVSLFAAPSATTPDLEFSIANFSQIPGFVGPGLSAFKLHLGMGSNVDDGIGEDFAPDQNVPIEITPTPTPSETPTTEVTPTPITPTPTITPTVPTATPPPPTDVPPTGGNLPVTAKREIGIAANKLLLPDRLPMSARQHPSWLSIPNLRLTTEIAERGWAEVEQKNGTWASEWDNIVNIAGWHKNSAQAGKQGNVIVSGHNNIDGSVFRDLWKLKGGETIYVWQNRVRYAYVVEKRKILPETYASKRQRTINASYLEQTDDRRLTLITCWPWNGSSHRVFVVAKLDPTRTRIDHRQ